MRQAPSWFNGLRGEDAPEEDVAPGNDRHDGIRDGVYRRGYYEDLRELPPL